MIATTALGTGLLGLGAVGIAVEDWRRRAYHVAWILPFATGAILLERPDPIAYLLRCGWVLVLVGVTYAVIALRRRGGVDFFAEYFGVGDLVLLVTGALVLEVRALLAVVVGACVLGIAYACLRRGDIPFATALVAAALLHALYDATVT